MAQKLGKYEIVEVWCGNSGFMDSTGKSTCPMCGKSIFDEDHYLAK